MVAGLLHEKQIGIDDQHYLIFKVWADQASMKAYLEDEGNDDYVGHYQGHVYLQHKETKLRKAEQPYVGDIHLVDGHLNVGVVAHEICHFILDWIRMWKLEGVYLGSGTATEERIATIFGEVVRKYAEWFWEEIYQGSV